MGHSWEELESAELVGQIVVDLRKIIKKGFWDFDLEDLHTLPNSFGAKGPADMETIRERLLSYLTAGEDAAIPDPVRLDELRWQTKFNLILFRYPPAFRGRSMEIVRPAAGAVLPRRVEAGAVRRAGGPEWQLVRDLSQRIFSETDSSGATDLVIREPVTPPDLEKLRRDYRALSADQLREGFPWRKSTLSYIAQLAELGTSHPVTIYAGADGECDVGEPNHKLLVGALLADLLPTDDLLDDAIEGDRGAVATDLVEAFAADVPDHYVGSSLRGLYSMRDDYTYEGIEHHLHARLADVIKQKVRSMSGFVANAIALLAFTLRNAGGDVEVITSYYDSDFAHPDVGDPDLDGFAFTEDPSPGPKEVTLKNLQGTELVSPPGNLILGEADSIDHWLTGAPFREPLPSRVRLLRQALANSVVICVGSSLADPALVRALVEEPGSPYPRFGIVLPPKRLRSRRLRVDSWDRLLRKKDEKDVEESRLTLDSVMMGLLAHRYLYFGVLPVIADWEAQVPQFLREIALRIKLEGRRDMTYGDRLSRWFDEWVAPLPADEPASRLRRRSSLQKDCVKELQRLRDDVAARHLGERSRGELLLFELWLRNPGDRNLFLWATSEGSWERAHTAPTESVRHADGTVQSTFHLGRGVWEDVDEGRWRYCASFNLVLRGDPYYHLPVGVVRVLSTQSSRERGDLARLGSSQGVVKKQAFEREVTAPLRELFGDRA